MIRTFGMDMIGTIENHASNPIKNIGYPKSNVKRDKEVTAVLVEQGWIVLRFWEHSIRKNLESCLDDIEEAVSIRKELMK